MFPFFGDKEVTTSEMATYKEVKWDFENNIPVIENGNFVIVEENEALKVWVYKALKTERFRYLIYSWNYGSEVEQMIGTSYSPKLTRAECIRYIEECITINPYITGISNVTVDFSKGYLQVSCTLNTIYGTDELEVTI